MVFGESPASIILATSSRITPLETSDSSLSPMFGRTQALSASCQPEMVAGFTGLRLRRASESIQRSDCSRNVVAGAVLAVNDCLVLTPSRSRNSRSFWRALDFVAHGPRATNLRLRSSPGMSCQYFPYVGACLLRDLQFWNTQPI